MDNRIYLANQSVSDIFKDWTELSMTTESSAEGQLPIYENEDGINLYLPGFSKNLSPSRWHNFDLGKILNECVASKEKPKTALDLQDITAGTYFQEELNKIHAMANFVGTISNNPQHNLDLMKKHEMLAPVHAIEQYTEIVKNSRESLEQALNEILPENEASKVKDTAALNQKNSNREYLNAAKEQNEQMIIEYVNTKSISEATKLLTGVSALELSKHAGVLGNIRGSLSAVTNPDIKTAANNAISIHLANTLQNAKLPSDVATQLLDSSTKISKALSLTSLTHFYEGASKQHKEEIKNELSQLTPNNIKKMSNKFSNSLLKASQSMDKNSLTKLATEIASTFSGMKPKAGTEQSETLSKLLDDTIFTLSNPHVDKNPKIDNSSSRTQTQRVI